MKGIGSCGVLGAAAAGRGLRGRASEGRGRGASRRGSSQANPPPAPPPPHPLAPLPPGHGHRARRYRPQARPPLQAARRVPRVHGAAAAARRLGRPRAGVHQPRLRRPGGARAPALGRQVRARRAAFGAQGRAGRCSRVGPAPSPRRASPSAPPCLPRPAARAALNPRPPDCPPRPSGLPPTPRCVKGIGKERVAALFRDGAVRTIADLYKLKEVRGRGEGSRGAEGRRFAGAGVRRRQAARPGPARPGPPPSPW
jgi:hypothetical protein